MVTIPLVQEHIMKVNTITIVLTIIKSNVHRLISIYYATNSLQCTRKDILLQFLSNINIRIFP